MPQATGTVSTTDPVTAVTVPAGQSIQVWGLQLYINQDPVVTVYTGETAKLTCMGTVGITVVQPRCSGKEPLIQGAAGEDLIIALSDNIDVHYNVQYSLTGL